MGLIVSVKIGSVPFSIMVLWQPPGDARGVVHHHCDRFRGASPRIVAGLGSDVSSVRMI
jgi:hypothetical protein